MSEREDVEAMAKELERFRKSGVGMSPVGAKIAAQGVLASSWLATHDEQVRADVWDEGYEAATTDVEARSAPPGPCGPVDPTFNPYRAALPPERLAGEVGGGMSAPIVKPYATLPDYADVEYVDGKLKVARTILSGSIAPDLRRRWLETVDILLDQRAALAELSDETSPVVVDIEDPYYHGQTLPDALAEFSHVHSMAGVCVKNIYGAFCPPS